MFGLKLVSQLLVVAACALGVSAHDDTYDEVAAREIHTLKARDALSKCQENFLNNRELHAIRLRKREELVSRFVAENNIQRRNTTPYHRRGITPRALFQELDCVLTPQTTIGPYYVKSVIRQDVRESQTGIPLLLDIQFVDVNTCTPSKDLYVDIWQANSTGIYGGVAAERTVGLTYLRGLQPIDANGILHMTTIFPGWYTNRAVHTHILAHKGGRPSADGKTYSGGTVPHIGQLFWDMNLIYESRKVTPYSTNRMVLLPNQNDFIFNQANSGYNALMKTEYIGTTIQEGLLSTITIGINPNYHNRDTGGPGLPNPTAK